MHLTLIGSWKSRVAISASLHVRFVEHVEIIVTKLDIGLAESGLSVGEPPLRVCCLPSRLAEEHNDHLDNTMIKFLAGADLQALFV